MGEGQPVAGVGDVGVRVAANILIQNLALALHVGGEIVGDFFIY